MGNLKFDFSHRCAVVTGGANGIGLELTRELLQAGARVSIWDYSQVALDAAKAEMKAYSDRLHTVSVDVSKMAACEAAAHSLPFAPHILVNNAGITRDKSLAKMTSEEWDSVIATNLTGLFNVTKSLLEKFDMSSPNGRRIINLASVVALYGNFGQTNYAAAKAGVIGMTKTWARELSRKGFTCNAVAPGFIRTQMTAKMPPEVIKAMTDKIPVQRLGEPADIARACMYLASEEGAYINGATISVDGGLVV